MPMHARAIVRAVLGLGLALSACGTPPDPSVVPTTGVGLDFPIECGPIRDVALCQAAIAVALTAKLNPPPVVAATVRRPRADDDCVSAFHPCGPDAIVVTIQSGDTLQEIALVPSADGWLRFDLIR